MTSRSNLKDIQTHVENFFSELEFDAVKHAYKVDDRSLESVSSVISGFTEPFDADRIAGYVAKSRKISKEEVLAEWDAKRDAACDKGNRVHDFGENYTGSCTPSDGYEKAVCAFWDTLPEHIEPFLMELKMFSLETGMAGTADIILYNTKTNKFIIADYKTNIDLFKNYKGKKMLIPFQDKLDMPFSKYELQLSFYQNLFEQCGYEVEDRKIIWLREDGTFEVYKTEDLTEKLKTIR